MALLCTHQTNSSLSTAGFAMRGRMNTQYGSFLPVTCSPRSRGAITWTTWDTVMRRALFGQLCGFAPGGLSCLASLGLWLALPCNKQAGPPSRTLLPLTLHMPTPNAKGWRAMGPSRCFDRSRACSEASTAQPPVQTTGSCAEASR